MRTLAVSAVLTAAVLGAGCDKPEHQQPAGPAQAPGASTPAPVPAPGPVQAAPVPADTAGPNVRGDVTRPDTAAALVRTAGTVRRVEVEGGGWVLDTPDGRFQPTDLPAAFQQDGLRVVVTLRPRPDMMSTLQVGRIADVVAIARR